MARVRCNPRVMFVLVYKGRPLLGGLIATCFHGRFGMAMAGQPLVARLRCALRGMSIFAMAWPRQDSP